MANFLPSSRRGLCVPDGAPFRPRYLTDLSAAQAAIRAGYSAKTAAEIGHENLIKPHVAAEIAKARMKRAERCELSADWVVDELRKIAGAITNQLYSSPGMKYRAQVIPYSPGARRAGAPCR